MVDLAGGLLLVCWTFFCAKTRSQFHLINVRKDVIKWYNKDIALWHGGEGRSISKNSNTNFIEKIESYFNLTLDNVNHKLTCVSFCVHSINILPCFGSSCTDLYNKFCVTSLHVQTQVHSSNLVKMQASYKKGMSNYHVYFHGNEILSVEHTKHAYDSTVGSWVWSLTRVQLFWMPATA